MEKIKRLFRRREIPESQWGQAFHRFRSDPAGMSGFIYIVLMSLVAILAYFIAPDDSPYANEQFPELHIKPPGFECQFLQVRRNELQQDGSLFGHLLNGSRPSHQDYPLKAHGYNDAVMWILPYRDGTSNSEDTLYFSMADVLFPLDVTHPVKYDPTSGSVSFRVLGESSLRHENIETLRQQVENKAIVSKFFLLGTDRLGRDLISRLVIGSRISLSVGLISVTISLLIGILLGATAGYFGGMVDRVIMWFTNVIWTIPTLLLVIAVTLMMGKGITQVFVAVGLTMWVGLARVVRGQVISIREKEFVEAGKALGYSNSRIIFRHILPNIMGPVMVVAAENFATAILTEAGLSFLGLGAQPPIPSWGEMTNAHHGYILLDKAYLAFIPGTAIMLLVLAFMLVGNAMRDALDVRAVQKR